MFDHDVRCAWCGKQMVHHFAPGDQEQGVPGDGDSALCMGCGLISVFDHEAPHGARRPTPREDGDLKRDPFIARMKMAWKKLIRGEAIH